MDTRQDGRGGNDVASLQSPLRMGPGFRRDDSSNIAAA